MSEILNAIECEERTSMSGKVTVIIPTSQAPLQLLKWALYSFLLRTDRELIEHFIVVINGPDPRTGDPTLQDQKQRFLEEVREQTWQGGPMPLTILRAWSRVGHAQAVEMALPWVHTEYYLLTHDDVILTRTDLYDLLRETLLDSSQTAIAYHPPLLFCDGQRELMNGQMVFRMPHLNSVFLVCRKTAILETGARWWGHHVPFEFVVDTGPCEVFSSEIGSWVYQELTKLGCQFEALPDDLLVHFTAASWGQSGLARRICYQTEAVACLEAQIEDCFLQEE